MAFRFGAESALIVRMSTFLADFKYSVRMLQRSPGFAVFAILALALGIGANVAVFSAVDAMLLRPMQFRDASRLVEVYEDGSKIGFPHNTPAPANFAVWSRPVRDRTWDQAGRWNLPDCRDHAARLHIYTLALEVFDKAASHDPGATGHLARRACRAVCVPWAWRVSVILEKNGSGYSRCRRPLSSLSAGLPLRLLFQWEVRSEGCGLLQQGQLFSVESRRLLQSYRPRRQPSSYV
jgi:hypothetical protein